ncbi:MAG TPA: prolipoprotein diacylglyceryl transferase, partial [Usitatibacter sp.]
MLTHPQFDPVIFSLGPLAVRWYGLMYVIGFIAVIVLGKYRVRKGLAPGLTERDVDDLLIYGVLGVILGGRLGYVLFYKFSHYLAHPAEILQIWAGGMSFHGGFLGVLVGVAIFCR